MPMVTIRTNPIDAFAVAAQRCVDMAVRLYDVLGKMITGRLSSMAISGPVEIAAISGRTAQQGIIPLLNLVAFISLNLGIVNLLPLPVLDGGHIIILLFESLFRRDLSMKVKEWIMGVGVVLLVLLMVLVFSQDIWKLVTRMG
jgi:regulator of sigma E protease